MVNHSELNTRCDHSTLTQLMNGIRMLLFASLCRIYSVLAINNHFREYFWNHNNKIMLTWYSSDGNITESKLQIWPIGILSIQWNVSIEGVIQSPFRNKYSSIYCSPSRQLYVALGMYLRSVNYVILHHDSGWFCFILEKLRITKGRPHSSDIDDSAQNWLLGCW